jgi:RNA polymerase sigma-70 factor (ECF subfamily)
MDFVTPGPPTEVIAQVGGDREVAGTTEGSEAVAELARVVAGDRDSVRRLLDESGPVVFGYVLARVGGERAVADDLVQDTFLEAIKSAHTFRGDSMLTTWLCAIARRRVAQHFEAERRMVGVDDETALDVAATVALGTDDVGDVDRRDEVVRALGRLPVLHRQVLVRKYLDDCPVAEIAVELGRSTVQVQSLLQRARVGLRRELEVVA